MAHKADTPAAAPTSHPRRRRRSSRAASVDSAPARSSHRRGTCTCHRACGCRPSLKRAYWAIRPTRTASRPRARHFKPTVPNRGVRLLVKRVKRLLVPRLAVDRFCRTASMSCCSPCARVRRSETARGCRRDHPLSAASLAPRENCAHTGVCTPTSVCRRGVFFQSVGGGRLSPECVGFAPPNHKRTGKQPEEFGLMFFFSLEGSRAV